MSKQPEDLVGYAAAIVQAFPLCEMKSPRKLYSYFVEERFKEGLGRPGWGEGPEAFEAWIRGQSEPGGNNLVFVCRAINSRCEELGKEPPLPVLPFPKTVIKPPSDGLPKPELTVIRLPLPDLSPHGQRVLSDVADGEPGLVAAC